MKTARSGDFFPRVCCNLLRVHVSGLCHCSNQSPRHCGSSYAATWCGFPLFICCWNSMGIGLIINSIQPDSWQEKAQETLNFLGLKTQEAQELASTWKHVPKRKKGQQNTSTNWISFQSNQTNQADHQFESSKISRVGWIMSNIIPTRPIGSLVVCAIAFIRWETQRAGDLGIFFVGKKYQSWLKLVKLGCKLQNRYFATLPLKLLFLAVYAGPIARNICTCHNEVGRLEILRTHMRKSAPRVMLTSPKNLGLYNQKEHTAQMPFPATYNRAFEVTIGTGRGFALSSRQENTSHL